MGNGRMRHAGIGWPNGPVDNAAVLALPSPDLLMLAPEGRWHHDAAVAAGKRVTWRAIPRVGKRPSELDWSPSRFVAEARNLTDAPSQPIREFIPWNELDLRYERGDNEDDWSGLAERYARIGGWGYSVVQLLRQQMPGTRLHWPAWTPDHHALGHLAAWAPAANLCDVVDFHAYDSLANIEAEYHRYRLAFPDKPLALTEWHCRGDLQEEERVLQWLAETMATDPSFEAAYFFIWRWHDAPGWWFDEWDIEHSPDRHALFMHPPTAAPAVVPPPEPEPIPMSEPKTREEVIAISNAAADAAGIPCVLMLACGVAESNLGWNARRPTDPAQDAAYWPDVSFGVWQQTARWSQEYLDWCRVDAPGHDPSAFPGSDVTEAVRVHYERVEHAAEVAAQNLKGKYRPGESDAIFKALCRYNWPAGDGMPADAATERNYRRGIAEAEAILGVAPPAPPARVTYNAATPAIPQNDAWSCAPTSARWGLIAVGRAPTEAWIESTMLAEGVVSQAEGLLDATGAGLAAFLTRHYGEFGYRASNEPIATFEALKAEAGRYPLMIGGRAWGHWSGLRGYDQARDLLLLANPANGWGGIEQTMSRSQFVSLGTFSMVRLTHPDLLSVPTPTPTPPPPAPTDPRDAEIAALRKQLADRDNTIGYLTGTDETDVFGALDRALVKARAAADTLRRHAP